MFAFNLTVDVICSHGLVNDDVEACGIVAVLNDEGQGCLTYGVWLT